MNRIWESINESKKIRLVIEEDENVGFYLIAYPMGSDKSFKDHLCDTFDEVLIEALESYGASEKSWTQIE